jgi:hypothetical protein
LILMGTPNLRRPLLKAATLLALASVCLAQAPLPFAQTIARLSEPNGYFDTDNLISNESSYLQVIPDLARRGVRGGAYIGVGPDQNFSYIAATRPAIAFIIDIRRDNELLHLLFKALFKESRTRVDYVSLLVGRIPPADADAWRSATIERIAKYVDEAKPAQPAALRARIERALKDTGVPLSDQDLKTIAGFHGQFIASGLSLQFKSTGRPPQWNYPTYRDMLVDTDSSGTQSNFLASEEAFQFVKGLEGRDLVIPVVGDLSGPSALASIGKLLASRGERLTAFYTSNVEFYLYREGTFPKFVANLRHVPHAPNAVIIRSVFQRFAVAGRRSNDNSTSELQPIDELVGR